MPLASRAALPPSRGFFSPRAMLYLRFLRSVRLLWLPTLVISALAASDPYLISKYDALHDSPMQQRLRALRPWPVGVVFIQQPGMGLPEMRGHFRKMRELGFTCLKQVGHHSLVVRRCEQ